MTRRGSGSWPSRCAIKHDGYRLIARRNGDRVRLYTRRGYNWADRYPRILEADDPSLVRSPLGKSPVTSCGQVACSKGPFFLVLVLFEARKKEKRDCEKGPTDCRGQPLGRSLRSIKPKDKHS
jgi:hypothetical protein